MDDKGKGGPSSGGGGDAGKGAKGYPLALKRNLEKVSGLPSLRKRPRRRHLQKQETYAPLLGNLRAPSKPKGPEKKV